MKKNLIFMSILMIGSQVIGSDATTSISNNDSIREFALITTTLGTFGVIAQITNTIQPGTLSTPFTHSAMFPAICAAITLNNAFDGNNVQTVCYATATLLTACYAVSHQLQYKS